MSSLVFVVFAPQGFCTPKLALAVCHQLYNRGVCYVPELDDVCAEGGLFIAGARFSNYVAWLDRPAVYRPGARCRHFGPVLDSDKMC